MTKCAQIETMMCPKSIAVVGASRSRSAYSAWMDIFARIVEFGFQGRLYPINPKADDIRGYKAYPNLSSIAASPEWKSISASNDRNSQCRQY